MSIHDEGYDKSLLRIAKEPTQYSQNQLRLPRPEGGEQELTQDSQHQLRLPMPEGEES
jgi:hypothetical protein